MGPGIVATTVSVAVSNDVQAEAAADEEAAAARREDGGRRRREVQAGEDGVRPTE